MRSVARKRERGERRAAAAARGLGAVVTAEAEDERGMVEVDNSHSARGNKL